MRANKLISDVNKLFIYTIMFMIFTSVVGISGLSNDYVISLAISQLSIVLPVVLFLISRRESVGMSIGLGRVKFIPTLAAIVAGFAIIPFLSMINTISMLFVENITDARVAEAAEKYPLVVLLFAVGLLPAVIEETVFRGVYFTAYRKAGLIKGALLSALIFAVMHGNLNQCAYAMVAGFLFAMINQAGGSLAYSIIIHFIINGVTVLQLYAEKYNWSVLQKLSADVSFESVGEVLIKCGPGAFFGLVICAFAYAVIRHFGNQSESEGGSAEAISDANKENMGEGKKNIKLFDGYLIWGLVIMFLNMIVNEVN